MSVKETNLIYIVKERDEWREVAAALNIEHQRAIKEAALANNDLEAVRADLAVAGAKMLVIINERDLAQAKLEQFKLAVQKNITAGMKMLLGELTDLEAAQAAAECARCQYKGGALAEDAKDKS